MGRSISMRFKDTPEDQARAKQIMDALREPLAVKESVETLPTDWVDDRKPDHPAEGYRIYPNGAIAQVNALGANGQPNGYCCLEDEAIGWDHLTLGQDLFWTEAEAIAAAEAMLIAAWVQAQVNLQTFRDRYLPQVSA